MDGDIEGFSKVGRGHVTDGGAHLVRLKAEQFGNDLPLSRGQAVDESSQCPQGATLASLVRRTEGPIRVRKEKGVHHGPLPMLVSRGGTDKRE